APPPSAHHALSLHDALPICRSRGHRLAAGRRAGGGGDQPDLRHRPPQLTGPAAHDTVQLGRVQEAGPPPTDAGPSSHGCAEIRRDRKSTRLNSSHVSISYAV